VNIADHAVTAADSPALIISDGGTTSFFQLYARSQRVAAVLHDAGLRRGDGVALVLPNRPEFFEITWGCQLSGLYYTAVNTHFTPDEVAYVIDDSDAKAVFVDVTDATMANLAAHVRDVNTAVDVHVGVGGHLPAWQSYEDALAAAGGAPPLSDGSEMLYSSGTTGRPKAVRRPLPADGNGSWAQAVLEVALTRGYGMNRSSVYLSPAPLYHAAGVNYTMAVNRVGAASIIMRKFDAEAVLRLIETHRVTHAQFVPTMFVRMLKLPEAVREKYDVSSLRCVIHAAAPCPVDVKHRMMEWFGPIIHEYYGAQRDSQEPRSAPTNGSPILARWANRCPRCTWWARTEASFPSGSPASCTSRVGPTSSTSRTPPRPRRSTTNAGGAPWVTWVTSTRTDTCT
jgi:long-chain acyl-CoA synthetase